MIKLYKRTNEGLFYHEAWISGMQIIQHEGKVGTNGDAYSFDYTSGQPDELSLERILKSARNNGFEPIPEEAHHNITLKWRFATQPTDIKKISEELEEIINEVFGWQGLGQVQQISLNTNSSQLDCLTVDYDICVNRISEILTNPRYSNFQIT